MSKEELDKINIHIVSYDEKIIKLVPTYFNLPNVTCQYANIGQCSAYDCIVSPGNSFGFMDGGIDRTLSSLLSTIENRDYIGQKVREVIKESYSGEQPVGTCMLIKTYNAKYPILAHAPTMCYPCDVSKTLNPYYAFKAVLQQVVNYNKNVRNNNQKIKSILTTTFCTGAGCVSPDNSLKQMRFAYDIVQNGVFSQWKNGREFKEKLESLISD
jgi:O-acetyl-ADP-ribose deacetylase (regulator of RNase III)